MNRSLILHYWRKGYRCAADIALLTKIPVPTLYYNKAKIRERGSVEHWGGNGQPCKITPSDS